MEECYFTKDAGNFTKSMLLHGYFSHILNCTNGTKSRKSSRIFKCNKDQ